MRRRLSNHINYILRMLKSWYDDFNLEIKIAGEKKRVKDIIDETLKKYTFHNDNEDSHDKAIHRHMKLAMLTMKNNNSSKTFFSILYHDRTGDKTFHMIHNSSVVEITKELFYCHIMDISTNFSIGCDCRYYVLNDNFQETFNEIYEFVMSTFKLYHEKLYFPIGGLSIYSVSDRNETVKQLIDEFVEKFPDIEPVFLIAFYRSLTLCKEE